MSKLTIVAFLVIVGVLAINGLRIRPIYNYDSPDLRLVPGKNGRPRLVRVYDRPDKPDHLVITQGRGAHKRTYVTDNVDQLYDSPMMYANAFPSHLAHSTHGKRKRRSILHPFHRAPLMHPLVARNIGLGLALRARALGALAYRNRILGARGLLGRRLVRPANVAQVAAQVGQHKTSVTQVATKQAPAPIPSAPAVVPSKAVDPYTVPADVYQPGPGIDAGIPNYVEQVGLPYNDVFDQTVAGQPVYQPAGNVELAQAGSIYNDLAVQSANGIYDQAGQSANGIYDQAGQPANLIYDQAGQSANLYNDLAVQSANGIHDQAGPIYDQAGQPASLIYDQAGQPANLIYDQAGQSGNMIYDQAGQSGNMIYDQAGQSGNMIYGEAGQPGNLVTDPTGQPVDLYNGPGAPYNDPAGAQVITGPQGTNEASDIFRNGIDIYSTDLGASLGSSHTNLGLGDYIVEGNGQNSYVLDSGNPSSIGVSSGTSGPAPAPRFM